MNIHDAIQQRVIEAEGLNHNDAVIHYTRSAERLLTTYGTYEVDKSYAGLLLELARCHALCAQNGGTS